MTDNLKPIISITAEEASMFYVILQRHMQKTGHVRSLPEVKKRYAEDFLNVSLHIMGESAALLKKDMTPKVSIDITEAAGGLSDSEKPAFAALLKRDLEISDTLANQMADRVISEFTEYLYRHNPYLQSIGRRF